MSRFLYHEEDHLAYFSKKKNGWWRATPCTWNFRSTGPRFSEIADFEPIFARSASVVTPSEKSSINTNRKSTMPFSMSLRSSSYVALKPPKGTQKKSSKIALCLKKVCCKVMNLKRRRSNSVPRYMVDHNFVYSTNCVASTFLIDSSFSIRRDVRGWQWFRHTVFSSHAEITLLELVAREFVTSTGKWKANSSHVMMWRVYSKLV